MTALGLACPRVPIPIPGGRIRPRHRTVWLKGELDLARVAEVELWLEAARAKRPRLIEIDLSELEFIDSAGLHGLERVRDRLRWSGVRLVLRSPSPQALRVLELSGVIEAFEISGE